MIRKGSYVSQQVMAESIPQKPLGVRVYGRWPKVYEQILIELYKTHTAAELAVRFNRKRQDIKNKLFRLGLQKPATESTHTT